MEAVKKEHAEAQGCKKALPPPGRAGQRAPELWSRLPEMEDGADGR